jgi:hypothetical protein
MDGRSDDTDCAVQVDVQLRVVHRYALVALAQVDVRGAGDLGVHAVGHLVSPQVGVAEAERGAVLPHEIHGHVHGVARGGVREIAAVARERLDRTRRLVADYRKLLDGQGQAVDGLGADPRLRLQSFVVFQAGVVMAILAVDGGGGEQGRRAHDQNGAGGHDARKGQPEIPVHGDS